MSQFDESKIRRDDEGKFATKGPAAEATGVDLVEAPEAVDWEERTGLTGQQIYEAATKAATYFARRYQIRDADELASETVAEYLHQVSSGERRAPAREKYNAEGHIRRISQGLAQRIASGHQHGGPNLTATKMYLQQREEYEARTGEAMTATQEDALANRIRDNWEGSRKPDINYHRARSLTNKADSLDQIREMRDGDESSMAFESRTATPEEQLLAAPTEFAADSAGARIDDRLTNALAPLPEGASAEEKQARNNEIRAAKSDARREVWTVLASSTGAPDIERDSMKPARAKELRQVCADFGGARRLVDRFNTGELTEEESNTLFEPWGPKAQRDGTAQENIVDTLSLNKAMTDDIWDSAVYTASGRR